jgi:peptidoglycan hydrolase CwlO-like protein
VLGALFLRSSAICLNLSAPRERLPRTRTARTWLQHAQDELVAAQSYVHHLEAELHERDEQLEASQAQAADLQQQVEHLQELIPPEPEEIEGMSDMDDD